MSGKSSEGRSLGAIGSSRRKPIGSQGQIVEVTRLDGFEHAPAVVHASVDGLDLVEWIQANKRLVDEQFQTVGAVLFRGFEVGEESRFQQLMGVLADRLLDYTYRSTPRTRVTGSVYTSTEYPSEQFIPLHNEMSYSRSWPLRIAFYSMHVAEEGGATPIADSRRVYERLPEALREEFEQKGVTYTRNYTTVLDLPWRTVFQVDSKAEVEDFCRQAGIEYEWLSADHLRTSQTCQAVARHPRTGEKVWFNQAHLFHVSSLPAAVRDALVAELGESNLPRNACYGDGTAFDERALEEIRRAYESEAIVFDWQKGDVLLLDNMLMAHGRQPFKGERKVLVAMGDPVKA